MNRDIIEDEFELLVDMCSESFRNDCVYLAPGRFEVFFVKYRSPAHRYSAPESTNVYSTQFGVRLWVSVLQPNLNSNANQNFKPYTDLEP